MSNTGERYANWRGQALDRRPRSVRTNKNALSRSNEGINLMKLGPNPSRKSSPFIASDMPGLRLICSGMACCGYHKDGKPILLLWRCAPRV